MYKYQPIEDYKIYENKNIKELLSYDNVCYWWLIEQEIFTELVEGIPYRHSKGFQVILWCHHVVFPYRDLFIKLLTKLIMNKYKSLPKNNSKVVLFREMFYQWRGDVTGKQPTKNIYHDDIITSLSKTNKLFSIIDDPPLIPISLYLNVRKNSIDNINRLLPQTYWSLKIWKYEKNAYYHFKKIANQINNNDEWYKLFSEITKCDIANIKSVVKHRIKYICPYIARYIAMIDLALREANPSVICQSSEQLWSGRSILYLANKYGIPIIAFQHGVMSSEPTDYTNHNKNDVGVSGNVIGTSFPIANQTLVWGFREAQCSN